MTEGIKKTLCNVAIKTLPNANQRLPISQCVKPGAVDGPADLRMGLGIDAPEHCLYQRVQILVLAEEIFWMRSRSRLWRFVISVVKLLGPEVTPLWQFLVTI